MLVLYVILRDLWGEYIEKKPLIMGGEDKYKNLIFVTKAIHRLIHEPDEGKIELITTALLLDRRQAKKLSELRCLAIN